MIEISNISTKIHDKMIIEDISFEIEYGQMIMLLGENGCGKTTLIKSLLGHLLLAEGMICADGKDIDQMTWRQKAEIFAYLPQIKNIVDDIKCWEVVISGRNRFMKFFQLPTIEDKAKAIRIMKKFKIEALAEKKISEISGGQLQIVYLCRCFIQEARCVLMDEPCTYLDFYKQHLFLQQAQIMVKEGYSILMSIHDPHLALKYGDKIIFMHQGKIMAKLDKNTGNMKEELKGLYHQIYPEQIIDIGG